MPEPSDSSEPTQQAPRHSLEVFVQSGCGAYHTFGPAGSESTRGPDLDGVTRELDEASLRESILSPEARIAPGFDSGLMPADYSQRLSPAELDELVAFLLGSHTADG